MPGWGSVIGVGGTNLLGSLGFGPGLLEQALRGNLTGLPDGPHGAVLPATVTARTAAVTQGAGGSQDSSSGSSGSAGQPDRAVLGKDDFLRLLLTELRMQDPINPVSDKEFMAQLAQFSALEQMTNLSSTLEKVSAAEEQFRQQQQALALLGRQVEVVAVNGGSTIEEETIRGRVDAVVWNASGSPLLKIGDKEYPLDSVRQVLQD